jgi:hypothetical protein
MGQMPFEWTRVGHRLGDHILGVELPAEPFAEGTGRVVAIRRACFEPAKWLRALGNGSLLFGARWTLDSAHRGSVDLERLQWLTNRIYSKAHAKIAGIGEAF